MGGRKRDVVSVLNSAISSFWLFLSLFLPGMHCCTQLGESPTWADSEGRGAMVGCSKRHADPTRHPAHGPQRAWSNGSFHKSNTCHKSNISSFSATLSTSWGIRCSRFAIWSAMAGPVLSTLAGRLGWLGVTEIKPFRFKGVN